MATITTNPNPIKWTPHGVQLELRTTIDSANVIRISETKFKISEIKVSWYGTWSGTWAGMKVKSGGKKIGIPYYEDKTGSIREGSGTLKDCEYSISGSGAQSKTITVTYTNYNSYSGETADKEVELTVTVPKYIEPVSSATLVITDGYNNTFSIEGSCKGGKNNKVVQSIAWGYTSNYELGPTSTTITDTASNKKISKKDIQLTISDNKVATKKIYASYTVTGETDKSGPFTVKKTLDIKQYVAPSSPGVPTLTESSYKNGRLTIKQPWTFSWEAARKTNDSSPVKGYLIRLYKQLKGSLKDPEPINILNREEEVISGTYYDYNQCVKSDNNSITIYPEINGFKPGDKVQVQVLAYSLFGDGKIKNTQKQSLASNWVSSDLITVENSGVMNVYADGQWREGQVLVYVDNEWKEATEVSIYDGTAWQESK